MEETSRKRKGSSSSLVRYLYELVSRSERLLGGRLVGVYAGGSLALGDYKPGRSDIDVAVIVDGELAVEAKKELVAALRHELLPCPARGLELVVYSRAAAAAETVDARFELNLNSGSAMPFRADCEPYPEEAHWFALDRAILRAHGIALLGPPTESVFGSIPRERLLQVAAQSLRWHELGDSRTDDAVLNACRALRFARQGLWPSKSAAGRWALGHVADRVLVEQALAARSGRAAPDARRAAAFVAAARSELETTASTSVASAGRAAERL
jgi:predicted nucleotidyltransferase